MRPRAAGRQDMGDARGQHARLAGAGAGQHQHRPVERLDRRALLGIEPVEITRALRRRAALAARPPGVGWRVFGRRR